jgi:hypothetical protein
MDLLELAAPGKRRSNAEKAVESGRWSGFYGHFNVRRSLVGRPRNSRRHTLKPGAENLLLNVSF